MEYGILGALLFIANVYALFKTWTSAASTGAKLLWTLLILVLPLLGFIIWFFAGPRGSASVNA